MAEERKISVEISVKPLSVNKVWQGRRFKTKEYKDYEEEVLYKLPKKEMLLGDKLWVVLDFYVKYPKKCDVDNFIKPILDILCKKGYIKDDRMIYDLVVRKFKGDNKIRVYIEKIKEEL